MKFINISIFSYGSSWIGVCVGVYFSGSFAISCIKCNIG